MKVFRSFHTLHNPNTIEEGLSLMKPGDYIGIRGLRLNGKWMEEGDYLVPAVLKVTDAIPPHGTGLFKMKHNFGSFSVEMTNGERYELSGYGKLPIELYVRILLELDNSLELCDYDTNDKVSADTIPTRGNLYEQREDYILQIFESALEVKNAIDRYQKCRSSVMSLRVIQKVNVHGRETEEEKKRREKEKAEKEAVAELDDLFKRMK